MATFGVAAAAGHPGSPLSVVLNCPWERLPSAVSMALAAKCSGAGVSRKVIILTNRSDKQVKVAQI